jgi:hypothetical protein
MEDEVIAIPPIRLRWSDWTLWADLKIDARYGGGCRVPSGVSGVYEVKYADTDERLTIGKASDLRMRIKQGLVKGKVPHSAGKRIRAQEDLARLVVRWAATDRPSAAEEELHKKYEAKFGKLPKYTEHT